MQEASRIKLSLNERKGAGTPLLSVFCMWAKKIPKAMTHWFLREPLVTNLMVDSDLNNCKNLLLNVLMFFGK